jgi:hypothetical protein
MSKWLKSSSSDLTNEAYEAPYPSDNLLNKIVIGTLITDISEKERFSLCSDAKKLSDCGKPLFMCSKSFGACRSFGERIKFKCYSEGYRVIWICDKLREK